MEEEVADCGGAEEAGGCQDVGEGVDVFVEGEGGEGGFLEGRGAEDRNVLAEGVVDDRKLSVG